MKPSGAIRFRPQIGASLFALALLDATATPGLAQAPDPVLAKVNGAEIRQSDLAIAEEEIGLLYRKDSAAARDTHRPIAGRLARGLDVTTASAILRALSAAEVYRELVDGAGWSADRYEQWLAALLGRELLQRGSVS